ncbi:hypothetical protein EV122DRAFT_284578 [Schizophyllum commune]
MVHHEDLSDHPLRGGPSPTPALSNASPPTTSAAIVSDAPPAQNFQTLARNVDTLKHNIEIYKRRNQKLARRVEELEGQKDEADAQCERLEKEREKMARERSNSRNIMQGEIDALRLELGATNNALDVVEEGRIVRAREMETLKFDLDAKATELREREGELRRQHAELHKMRDEVSSVRNALAKSQDADKRAEEDRIRMEGKLARFSAAQEVLELLTSPFLTEPYEERAANALEAEACAVSARARASDAEARASAAGARMAVCEERVVLAQERTVIAESEAATIAERLRIAKDALETAELQASGTITERQEMLQSLQVHSSELARIREELSHSKDELARAHTKIGEMKVEQAGKESERLNMHDAFTDLRDKFSDISRRLGGAAFGFNVGSSVYRVAGVPCNTYRGCGICSLTHDFHVSAFHLFHGMSFLQIPAALPITPCPVIDGEDDTADSVLSPRRGSSGNCGDVAGPHHHSLSPSAFRGSIHLKRQHDGSDVSSLSSSSDDAPTLNEPEAPPGHSSIDEKSSPVKQPRKRPRSTTTLSVSNVPSTSMNKRPRRPRGSNTFTAAPSASSTICAPLSDKRPGSSRRLARGITKPVAWEALKPKDVRNRAIRSDTPLSSTSSDLNDMFTPSNFRSIDRWDPTSPSLQSPGFAQNGGMLFNLSNLSASLSSQGFQAGYSSGYDVGMLLQCIRELENQNVQLTQSVYELQGELRGVRSAYNALLERLDGYAGDPASASLPRTAPPPTPAEAALLAVRNRSRIVTLNRNEHPRVRFWFSADFLRWTRAQLDVSALGTTAEIRLQYRFLEDADGQCIEEKRRIMLEVFYPTWRTLLHAPGLLPETWGRASFEVKMFVWATM